MEKREGVLLTAIVKPNLSLPAGIQPIQRALLRSSTGLESRLVPSPRFQIRFSRASLVL